MFDIPVSVKVLKFIKEKQKLSRREIIDRIKGSQEYIDKALQELVKRSIITEKEGIYTYVSTQRSKEFSEDFINLYEKFNRERLERLLIKGLLGNTPLNLNTFLEILEEEEFSREELNILLAEEEEKGYIKRIKIPEIASPRFPLDVTNNFFTDPFIMFLTSKPIEFTDYEKLKMYFKRWELEVQEEDYLVGLYPPELSDPAREFVKREHEDLRTRLFRFASPLLLFGVFPLKREP
jgi:DNA-binding transcriptional regulator YhcF (GntR family)